jgi:ATP-dependent Clp protease ATP-binding subunit ClpC
VKNKLSTEVLKKSLGKNFSKDFLNRIYEIVVFNEFDNDEIEKIVKIEIKKFINRLSEIEYKIQINEKAISFLAKKGYNKEYGARPVKRAIQKFIEDEVAKMIVKNKIKKNDNIVISHKRDNDKLDITVSS